MNKIMKYLLLVSISIISIVVMSNKAYAESPNDIMPTKYLYVNDFANILPQKEQQEIIDQNLKYKDTEEKPEIVVTTLDNTGGLSIDDFTNKLMSRSQWKIGDKQNNNGVHILFAKNNGQNNILIKTGSGLKAILTKDKLNNILNKYKTDIKSDDTNHNVKAIMNIYNDIIPEIQTHQIRQPKENFILKHISLIIAFAIILFGIGLFVGRDFIEYYNIKNKRTTGLLHGRYDDLNGYFYGLDFPGVFPNKAIDKDGNMLTYNNSDNEWSTIVRDGNPWSEYHDSNNIDNGSSDTSDFGGGDSGGNDSSL